MKANEILFRCSSLGYITAEGNSITEKQLSTIEELESKARTKILTDKQQAELDRLIDKRDNPELPETCKTHLIDVYCSHEYGRRERITNKFLQKGNVREEDSITLVSLQMRTLFEKNDVRLNNAYIQGEPDLYLGESILKAKRTIDTKSSWSLHTFMRAKHKKIDPMHYWQGQGYMDLTGADQHTVAYCLVNGTAEAILREKRLLAYEMKIDDETDPAYVSECQQIERNHIFDLQAFMHEYPGFVFHSDIRNWIWDIPREKRMHTVTFDRSDSDIRKMHDRVLQCREWMEVNLYETSNQEIEA